MNDGERRLLLFGSRRSVFTFVLGSSCSNNLPLVPCSRIRGGAAWKKLYDFYPMSPGSSSFSQFVVFKSAASSAGEACAQGRAVSVLASINQLNEILQI